jgi:hypothetical protein
MLGSSGALIASHIDDVQTTGGPLVTGISEAGEDGRTFQASTGAGSEMQILVCLVPTSWQLANWEAKGPVLAAHGLLVVVVGGVGRRILGFVA